MFPTKWLSNKVGFWTPTSHTKNSSKWCFWQERQQLDLENLLPILRHNVSWISYRQLQKLLMMIGSRFKIPGFDFLSRPSGGHWRGHQQHWQWISADGISAFQGLVPGNFRGQSPPRKKTEIPHVCWNVSILRFELWEWRFVVDSFSCQLITDHHLQLGCSSVLHISNMCPEELCFFAFQMSRWEYIWSSTG